MKISVIIATKNRKVDLKNTIIAFKNQTYENKEIIVIDNASDDGTKEMMRQDFPEIQYMWLPDNIDILAQNIGISISNGDIIWRTDDDSYPEDVQAFEKVVQIFQNNSEIDIIATEDIEVRSGNLVYQWYPLPIDKNNIPDEGFVSNRFHGTGAAIKKEVFSKVGGFWEFGHEELEFSTQAIKAGFNIRYFPNIRVLHFSIPGGRNYSIRWLKLTNQLVRYYFKHFPLSSALIRSYMYVLFDFSTALFRGVKISALIENFFRVHATAIHTYREEYSPMDKETIEKVTLGISAFSEIKNFTAHILKSLKFKLFKK
jgi:GT2 family glycosyltransferase